MKIAKTGLRKLIREQAEDIKASRDEAYSTGVADAKEGLDAAEPDQLQDPDFYEDYLAGYREGSSHNVSEGKVKVTKSQLRRIIREAMDYDPLGDGGVPHVGAGPKYALAFVDASYGDRRMELVVREEDMELARKVMKKMRKQGQVSGVQPTRRKFDPRDVTTKEDLMRMLSEATVSPKLPNLDPHYEDGWNDATVYGEPRQTPTHPPKAVDAYWDGYQDGEDHARRFEEPPMLEAKLPSRSRMKELKDVAWLAASNILKEGITDIVFHKTRLEAAANIIKNNKFLTSVAFGQEWVADEQLNKGSQYFLSTMRSPMGEYPVAPPAVMFKLDGRKLSYNHKGYATKWWGDYGAQDEMEDRLLTDNPYIDNAMSYIKEIHIFMEIPEGGKSDMTLDRLKEAELIHKIAESNKIPVFFYGNEKDFKILNRTKHMTFEQWKEAFKEAGQSFSEPKSGNALPKWKKKVHEEFVDLVEIIKGIETGDTSSIDKSDGSMWYKLKHSRSKEHVIGSVIHNIKDDPSARDNIIFIGRHMKKHGGLKGQWRYISKAIAEIDEKEGEEPPMLEAKLPLPSRSRMKELKDAAWAKVSERVAFLPYDVRSVRIVPHQNLSDDERVEPEFEDQMMMRVYVKDRNGRNPVFDVVMNLASGRAEGVSAVR